jgi:hypothetical protein
MENTNPPSAAYLAAFQGAMAQLRQMPKAAPGSIITAEQVQEALGPEAATQRRALANDIMIVLAEIQRWRDAEPGFDRFLRERGIITRARAVQA